MNMIEVSLLTRWWKVELEVGSSEVLVELMIGLVLELMWMSTSMLDCSWLQRGRAWGLKAECVTDWYWNEWKKRKGIEKKRESKDCFVALGAFSGYSIQKLVSQWLGFLQWGNDLPLEYMAWLVLLEELLNGFGLGLSLLKLLWDVIDCFVFTLIGLL